MTATFSEKRFGEAFLDGIVDWIAGEMDPDKIYRENFLKDWIRNNLEPGDVYDFDTLAEWARANGFVGVE